MGYAVAFRSPLYCIAVCVICIYFSSVDFDIRIGKDAVWLVILGVAPTLAFSMSCFHSAHALPGPTIWARSDIPLPRSYIPSCGGCHT